jgi:Fic family protein
MEMAEFATRLKASVTLVEHHLQIPSRLLSEPAKLVLFVQMAAALFVEFLEIHPYANGNGHMARTMLLFLLARRNLFPARAWNIDPKPADPPYSNLISQYRSGNRDTLIKFIIDAL